MSFDGIKTQLKTRLGALGLRESQEPFDFEHASSKEFGNTYIIIPIAGELNEDSTLVGRFEDNQTWEIKIAYGKSSHSDIVQKDKLNRK